MRPEAVYVTPDPTRLERMINPTRRDRAYVQLEALVAPYLDVIPDRDLVPTLRRRYGVTETRLMAVEQVEDLVEHMRIVILQAEHECDTAAQVDCDLCQACREHAGFCSVCGMSECCGAGSTS